MTTPEWIDGFKFEVLVEDPESKARLGKLTTPHGVVFTPAFMPVGTYGAVKGILPEVLQNAGAEILLSNALHLEFRPGSETVAKLGGIHKLMGWDGPILTDSGGFQTYSLAELIKQKDEGIEVRAPIDGTKHLLTPARVIQIQRNLGTDFMMPLDVCAPGQAERKDVEHALTTTLAWATQSKQAFLASEAVHGQPQALFGIVQGGTHEDLRRQAAESLLEIDFFAYAVGGLAVGESKEDTWRIINYCTDIIPTDKIRYMMGTGTPEDLDTAISLGIDLFDCVMPTRNGRKGTVFVNGGKLNLRNAAFKDDPTPIEYGCSCYACQKNDHGTPRYSRGAIRHFLNVGEVLGMQLGALHNLTFYLNRLVKIKERLKALMA